jgi:threonine dehydratase
MTPTEYYPSLAKAIGLTDLYFKREDLHPYHSHKGRSIPFMIDQYYKNGDRRFAITSSGNAALASALHVKKLNTDIKKNKHASDNEMVIDLSIFVGNHIETNKLEKIKRLEDEHIHVFKKERPLQALSQAVENGYRSLRQSTDDIALLGYEPLAKELSTVKDIGAIFIGTSSGTTAQALAQYFIDANDNRPEKTQIHIIQTSSCHPISDAFDTVEIVDERSTADAIVDQIAKRKSTLVPLIQKTGGNGWIASNSDIEMAQRLVKKHTGLDISTNSALSVVGAMKTAYIKYEISGAIVCLICGD